MVARTCLTTEKYLVEHRRGGESWVVEVAADTPEEAARHVAAYGRGGMIPGVVCRLPAPIDFLQRFFPTFG